MRSASARSWTCSHSISSTRPPMAQSHKLHDDPVGPGVPAVCGSGDESQFQKIGSLSTTSAAAAGAPAVVSAPFRAGYLTRTVLNVPEGGLHSPQWEDSGPDGEALRIDECPGRGLPGAPGHQLRACHASTAGGGTPLRTPLVPAYKECTNLNTTHVAPLSYGSANRRVRSEMLTMTGSGGFGIAAPGRPLQERAACHPAPRRWATSSTTGSYSARPTCAVPWEECPAAPRRARTTPASCWLRCGSASPTMRTPLLATPAAATLRACRPRCGTSPSRRRHSAPTTAVRVGPAAPEHDLRRPRAQHGPGVPEADRRGAHGRGTGRGPDGVINPTPVGDPLGLGCPPICGNGDESSFVRSGLVNP